MAHVLFDGDIRQHPALRSLFWQWGVTVGRLPGSVQGGGWATVEDCDAVIYVGSEADPVGFVSGAMPDGAEEEGVAAAEAAPLLVIGSGPVAAEPWIIIPDSGPGGSRLKVALQSCRERARMLRGDPHYRHDLEKFRDFLGHELRSPLTAIKTALTALVDAGGQEPGPARMLWLALRNLGRLAETVEWSQELMSLAEAPPAADIRPVSLASLAKAIPDYLDFHLDEKNESREVLTDPRLLGMLAGQMERVLTCVCPGNRPVFRLGVDTCSGDCRIWATVPENLKDAPVSRVTRTVGTEGGHDHAGGNRDELDHLVRMLISPHLLQVLGLRPRLFAEPDQAVELTIGLPSGAGSFSSNTAPDPVFTV